MKRSVWVTPTVCPARAGSAAAALIGDEASSTIEVAVPKNAFNLVIKSVCLRQAAVEALFKASPPTQHSGPHT